jgi:macrolide transport system ATP-binding/permease protein
MYEVKNLSFTYEVGGVPVEVLKNLNFKVEPGDFVGIQGPSGSGKSTLFYVLGFMLKPTSGTVVFDQLDISKLDQDELTTLRNRKIGFVFQQFHLLPKTTVIDNVLLPTRYPSELLDDEKEDLPNGGTSPVKTRALKLIQEFGLGQHVHHYQNQLSGGQQQRVAIARALMNDVDLILADEPTGNLDSKTAMQILDVLTELNRQGKTIILITHDAEVAKRCSKVYFLKDGAFTGVQENFKSLGLGSARTPQTVPKIPKVYSFSLYRKVARAVFPLVVQNLLRNKGKSLLTMLGVIIGVAAVLAMVTLGQFTKARIIETYETLGVNKLQIRGYRNWNLKAEDRITNAFREFNWEKDLLSLKKVFPEIRQISPELNNGHNRALSGGLEVEDRVNLLGVSPDFLYITGRKIIAGRALIPFDIENQSPVCVIGFEIAERLFARRTPIGEIVTVTDGSRLSVPCKVIGVLEKIGTTKDTSSPPNLNVIVPYPYFQNSSENWWTAEIHTADLQVDPKVDVEQTGKRIQNFFEQRYGKSGRFSVDSDSTLIAQMKKFLNIFQWLLSAIALLALGVGGIGINNMMLVSVTERIREFGIRKALGATDRSVRTQVLLESLTLCVIAGITGAMIGFLSYELLIFLATRFVPQLKFEWIFEPAAIALSVISIVAVGVVSGLVPALRAEKLQVIEALRTE